MAEPPPHAETFHTTPSLALGPAVFAAETGTNDTCHSQPGVPAPSNALSVHKNIHVE